MATEQESEKELAKLREELREDWGDDLYRRFFPEEKPILGE